MREELEFVGGSKCGEKLTPQDKFKMIEAYGVRFEGLEVGNEIYVVLSWKKSNKEVLFFFGTQDPVRS